MRLSASVAAIALCLAAPLAALGGEGDPWAGQPRHLRHRMEELADAEARGELGEEERDQVRRYWATHLYRTDALNAVESAHYSIAELFLERANAEAAVAELGKVLAAAASDDVQHLTHLNLGQVHRLHLNDAAKAAEHFEKVAGALRHKANAYELAMLEDKGKLDEAAALLEKQATEAKEQGAKLAALHRLAALYRRHNLDDKALATYQRITAGFTPAIVKEIHDALALEVDATFQRIRDLQLKGAGHEAEQLMQGLHRRAQELRFAGRWDEARAYQRAMHKGFRAMQEFHRQREREERERQERQRQGGEGEGRPPGQF